MERRFVLFVRGLAQAESPTSFLARPTTFDCGQNWPAVVLPVVSFVQVAGVSQLPLLLHSLEPSTDGGGSSRLHAEPGCVGRHGLLGSCWQSRLRRATFYCSFLRPLSDPAWGVHGDAFVSVLVVTGSGPRCVGSLLPWSSRAGLRPLGGGLWAPCSASVFASKHCFHLVGRLARVLLLGEPSGPLCSSGCCSFDFRRASRSNHQ